MNGTITATDMSSVLRLMEQALETPDPAVAPLYDWLRYHMGWAELDGTRADARRAKGVRPLACLLSAAALGGDPEAAAPCAAAVELTHEFSLIHDDIQDGDALRRGRPALWTLVGEAQAIGAGDLLWAIARRMLGGTPVPADRRVAMMDRYDAACVRLAQGQHLDLAFEGRERVDPADYRMMIAGKTGALLGLATALGASAAGARKRTVSAMADFGEAVGVAFQMRDDWLGLWGDPAETGKPVGADLARRKKSLPLLIALDHPTAGPPLAALLDTPEIESGRAAEMAERLADAGIADQVAEEARAVADAARAALRALDLRAGPALALDALARRAVDRAR